MKSFLAGDKSLALVLVLVISLMTGSAPSRQVVAQEVSTPPPALSEESTSEWTRTLTATPTPIPTITPVPVLQRPLWVQVDPLVPDDGNTYNGYWWNAEGWVPGLVTFDTQFLRLPTVSMGAAVFYAPGVMEANVEYRGLSMAGMCGAVAVEFCSEIGHTVWLLRPGEDELDGWEGPFMVADCSRRNDLFEQIMFRDQVVEVDFDTAVRWGLARYGGSQHEGRWSTLTGRLNGVLVSTIPPRQYYDGVITDLSMWFLQKVEFARPSENRRQIENYRPPTDGGLPGWLINGTWTVFP